jgi:hypothetical protein
MEVIVAKYGQDEAKELYKTTCPLVKASIGQHIRHSMDHIDRVVVAASDPDQREIHYDTRKRGVLDERDMDAAKERILRVDSSLDKLSSSSGYVPVLGHSIEACFMLSGDSEMEYMLPSTVARELGFAAHHAIHHLAMVKVIATSSLINLEDSDLPSDFGRAPSTVNYDHKVASTKQAQ